MLEQLELKVLVTLTSTVFSGPDDQCPKCSKVIREFNCIQYLIDDYKNKIEMEVLKLLFI